MWLKSEKRWLALALVCDLCGHREQTSADGLADFEAEVLAGFVRARAVAGLMDSPVRSDTNHLGVVRDWFGHPLWEMQAAEAGYFGRIPRDAMPSPPVRRTSA